MSPHNTEEAARKAKIAAYYKKYCEANREKIAAGRKKYRQANPEQEAARTKKWREANPEQEAAGRKKYREENPEKVAASHKKWREANTEKIAARNKKYREENPEKVAARHKKYSEASPESSRASTLRRRARLRGAAGWSYTTASHISARWEAFGGRCWMCGNPATAMDHVKPLAAGGSHFPSNQRPACRTCNSSKGAKWPHLTTTIISKQREECTVKQ